MFLNGKWIDTKYELNGGKYPMHSIWPYFHHECSFDFYPHSHISLFQLCQCLKWFIRLNWLTWWYGMAGLWNWGSWLVTDKIMLHQTVNWPVCPSVSHTSGAQGQIFVTVRQLPFIGMGHNFCWNVNYSCWSSPVQTFCGLNSDGLSTIFTLSNLWLHQPGRPDHPQEHDRSARFSATGFHFGHLLQLAGLWHSYLNPLPCRACDKNQSQGYDSVPILTIVLA